MLTYQSQYRAPRFSNPLAAIVWIVLVTVGLFLLVLTALIGAFSDAPGTAIVPFLAFCIYLMVITYALRILRGRRAASILSYLHDGARLNLPLSRWLTSAIPAENLTLRKRLVALRDSLDNGQRLSDALDRNAPEIPARVVRAIAAAEQIGSLPAELSRLSRRPIAGPLLENPMLVVYRIYPLIIIAVAILPVVFVFPKFFGIMHDFKVPAPWALRLVKGISQNQIFQIALALALGIFALSVLFSAARLFLGRRLSMPFLSALADYLIWPIPFAGTIARDIALADLCAFLADAIEAGRPLDESLAQAASAQPNALLARRIRSWSRAVAAGQSLSDSARAAHMPSVLVSMLATAVHSENLVQTLQFLSRHYDLRVARARALLQSLAMPVSVFLIGIVVAILALSLFQPLVVLIDATMNKPYGGF